MKSVTKAKSASVNATTVLRPCARELTNVFISELQIYMNTDVCTYVQIEMRIDGCGTSLLMRSNVTELVLTFWLDNADNSLFLYFFFVLFKCV